MSFRAFIIWALAAVFFTITSPAAPVIDPLPNVTVPAGKSLTLPITATSSNGRALTYTITSSTNAIAIVMHTNNPFWQLTVAQAASAGAPGAYQTPFRGGLVSVTNVGTMTFMLFPEYAPHTVNVFQGLTYSGFYNSNTIFHRVISGFMIQGGDPLTNGTGGLVFNYNDEFHPQAMFTGSGQLALANSGIDTDGSQFFVTIEPYRSGDFIYTLFGQLLRGFPVLTNINSTVVDTNSRPFANEIIQMASNVTNTTDTALTLVVTNVSGVTGTIKVVASDGAGGIATNTFTVTTVTDASSDNQPFFYPSSPTQLVGPVNQTLTNFVTALELDGSAITWNPEFGDLNSENNALNSSLNISNSTFESLTYNVTNNSGEMQLFIVPATNYVGPVTIYSLMSANSQASIYWDDLNENPPNLDYQISTYVFGDTYISAQTNSFTVMAGKSFTNALLATFTNGVAGSAATNFTASINWGDNSITNGTITTNAAGQKIVLASHAYPWPGTYPVYVQVQSSIGASATVLTTVISALPKLSVASSPGPLGTNGFAFTLQLPAALNGSIQVSTNLTAWTTLTNFVGTNGTLIFKDSTATNSSRRYYRAVIP